MPCVKIPMVPLSVAVTQDSAGMDSLAAVSSNFLLSYSYPLITHVDINECDSTPCDVNAMCQDTNGSFVCACNSGFSGNGFICSSKLLIHQYFTFKVCRNSSRIQKWLAIISWGFFI